MPRYYCDYCDTYLTHDSPSVRKQHNAGYKHKANVRSYYQQFEEQQTQSLIDQRIKEHLGQAAAFQTQVGAAFNAHLMRPPVMRPPILPGGPIGPPPLPGVRPPILPRPVVGAPGYGATPPPGVTAMPMQMTSLPRPPTLTPPAPGAMPESTTNGAFSMVNSMMPQVNPISAPGAPATPATTASQDGFSYVPTSEANH